MVGHWPFWPPRGSSRSLGAPKRCSTWAMLRPRAGRATCDCASTRSISRTPADAEPATASSAAAGRTSRPRARRNWLRLFMARLLPKVWTADCKQKRAVSGIRKRPGVAFLRPRVVLPCRTRHVAARRRSALARLETRVGLADHEDLATATNDLAVTVTGLRRLQGGQDLHDGPLDWDGGN